jgi:hypothetical protein
MSFQIQKHRATMYSWGAKQFGFARDESGQAWFIHGFNIVGGRRDLLPGTVIEFEDNGQPIISGKSPTAVLIRVVEEATR